MNFDNFVVGYSPLCFFHSDLDEQIFVHSTFIVILPFCLAIIWSHGQSSSNPFSVLDLSTFFRTVMTIFTSVIYSGCIVSSLKPFLPIIKVSCSHDLQETLFDLELNAIEAPVGDDPFCHLNIMLYGWHILKIGNR